MDKEYSVTLTWTDEEFLQFTKFLFFKRGSGRKTLIFINAIIVGLFAYYAITSPSDIVYYLVASLFLMAVFNYNFMRGWKKRALKSLHENKYICGVEHVITFTDTAVRSKTPYNEMNVEYSMLDSIVETPTHFYVMTARHSGINIPKDKCSPELIAKVKSVIEEYPNLK